MRYKVGDKVRVRSDLQISRRYGSYMFASGMDDYKGSVVTISKAHQNLYFYCIEEDGGRWIWADEMFEGLAEELTAEETIKILGEICCGNELCGGCPIGEAKGKRTCQSFRRDKTEEVLEILKQWKKDHEKKEVKVQDKMYCRIVDGDGSTVYTEALPDESILNDRMTEILTKFCSEHDDNYFAVCERRWEVVK
nr:MAG TPA: Nfn subunit A, Nfn subunit [Caudoviricetes sp.]